MRSISARDRREPLEHSSISLSGTLLIAVTVISIATEGCPSLQGLRIKRHEYLKTSLARTLRDAKAEVQVEVLARDPVNRRADIVASGKCCGGSVAIDITVTSAIISVNEKSAC